MDDSNSLFQRIIAQTERITRTDIRYILRGGSWLLLGQSVGIMTALLLAVSYAHFLSKEVYGTYKYLLSIFAVLSLFSLTGMDAAVQKGIAQGKEGIFWKSFFMRIKTSIGATVSCLLAAGYYFYNGNLELAVLFLISAPFLLVIDPFSHYNSLLIGKKLFKESSFLNICLQISSALCMVGAIFVSKSIFSIILAYLLSTVILRGIILIFVTNHHPLNKIDDNESLSLGKHMSAVGLFSTISGRLDAVLLFHFLGPSALAVYSFAQAATNNIQNIFKLVTGTLAFPKFAEQNKEILKKTLLRKVYLAHFITIPLALLGAILMPAFFALLFPKYIESVHYAQAMIGLLAFSPLRFISTAITAKANVRTYYTLALSNPIISSLCLLICIPLWGIWGAIVATAIQQSISNLLGLYLFRKM